MILVFILVNVTSQIDKCNLVYESARMKNLIILSCVALALSGCGRIDRWTAGITGKGSEICHRGVTYVQMTSGATVAVDRAGKPFPCGKIDPRDSTYVAPAQ